jgi:endoglucanase
VYLTSDLVGEADQTFDVVLSSPTGATIANGTGTVTIVDDD